MINPIEAKKLSTEMADQLRVRLGYHSVSLTAEDQKNFGNFLEDLLSNYTSDQLLTGDVPNGIT